VTEKQIVASIRTAHHYGGGFIKKLAEAALAADPYNRNKVLSNWPDLLTNYGPGSNFYREDL
jgi:hypothetical protein